MKFFLFIIIIFTDQITKFIVNKNIAINSSYKINFFLDIVNIKNKGISFGLFSGIIPSWIISIIVIGIILFLIMWFIKSDILFEKLSLLIIVAGALGNLIDRLIFKQVTDFIFFNYNNYYWPAFNFADVFISFGIITLIIAAYMQYRYDKKNE